MKENTFFPEIRGNFGFGCMRLPMNNGKVDYDIFIKMADAFVDAGFNYFDTAHPYLGGQSEIAIGDCVSKRYDRSKFLLTNKLTEPYFNVVLQIKLCSILQIIRSRFLLCFVNGNRLFGVDSALCFI